MARRRPGGLCGWMTVGLALAVSILAVQAAPAAAPRPVAIFRDPGFPFYIASEQSGPAFAAYCLRRAGIACEMVDATALADPSRFSAKRYPVLVWTYGNSYPHAALANLRRFHQEKGCIVALGGVPFCHPCVREGDRWADRIDSLGWDAVSHRAIGTGLWGQAPGAGCKLVHAAGDPLGIGWLRLPSAPGGTVQFVNRERTPTGGVAPNLRREDRVVPIVSLARNGASVGDPACLVEHHCPEFDGAVDVWAGTTLGPMLPLQHQRTLVVASCALLLERTGQVTPARRSAILQALRRATVAPETRTASYRPFILRSPAPARQVVVLDVSATTQDERNAALSVQGIVNRTQPRIWLTASYRDTRWLQVLRQQGYTTVPCASLDRLVARFRSELRGAVVYDAAEPWTVNLATMESATRNAVMASANLARRLRLPRVADLRRRFRGPSEAMEWALGTLWPRLSHEAAASMAPGWDAPRDYLVQHRIFTFWLDGKTNGPRPDGQGLLFESLLAKLPLHAAIYGWWQDGVDGGIGEGGGVEASSRYCKITVCTVGAYNLSVHSGLPMPDALRQTRKPVGSLDRAIYLTFILSDGDNFGENLYTVIAPHWRDPLRGRAPIGWGICPTQVELTPLAVREWYRSAGSNDLFVTMDGMGYIYPNSYGSALSDVAGSYAEFLRRSSSTMKALDQHHLWFLGGTDRADQMAGILHPDGLFGEYAVPPKQDQRLIGNTAAIWSDVNPWEKPYDTVESVVQAVRTRVQEIADRPAFLFVGVNGFCIGPSAIVQVLRQLGPGYVAVRPDELCALYRRFRLSGVDATPTPRTPLDLSMPVPAPVLQKQADGSWLAREQTGEPDQVGWYTDPAGTGWVRKKLDFAVPAGATRATVAVFVRGTKGKRVIFDINGHRHSATLRSSLWQVVRVAVPISELRDSENALAYTGNPDARLFTGGDSVINLGHSEYGGGSNWSKLAGELACWVELR